MSQKSALAWYHRNKGSDAIKARRNKRQETFKTLGGRLLLSCDYAAKKRQSERFAPCAYVPSYGTKNGIPLGRAA